MLAMKSRQHLLFLLIFLLIAIVISLLSNDFREILFRGTRIDSIGHFIGFFLLTWFLNGIIKLPLAQLFIVLILYAALTEIGQYYLGFRNGEVSDFIADLVGISFYSLLKWIKVVYGKQKTR